jgi:hypothetical protein
LKAFLLPNYFQQSIFAVFLGKRDNHQSVLLIVKLVERSIDVRPLRNLYAQTLERVTPKHSRHTRFFLSSCALQIITSTVSGPHCTCAYSKWAHELMFCETFSRARWLPRGRDLTRLFNYQRIKQRSSPPLP